MTLISFLQKPQSVITAQAVTVLSCKQYPTLVMADIKKQLIKAGVACKQLDIASYEPASLQALLQMSFLGQTCTYLVSDLTDVKKNVKDLFIGIITHYQGPHTIICSLPDAKNYTYASALVLDVQDVYTFEEVKHLYVAVDETLRQKYIYFFTAAYKYKKQFSLDDIWMLSRYASLVSAQQYGQFFQDWFCKLVVADSSLYTLSQLFFEKESQEFLHYWQQIKDNYSEMFWISFWSEQLYRTYFYVVMVQKGNPQAKAIGYGLPFSLLKFGWQQIHISEIMQAHQAVYALDGMFKHGKSVYELEAFFFRYFNHEYR